MNQILWKYFLKIVLIFYNLENNSNFTSSKKELRKVTKNELKFFR